MINRENSTYDERFAVLATPDGKSHTIRESVAKFALVMNQKLTERAVRHGGNRPNWLKAELVVLLDHMKKECVELHDALIQGDAREIRREAADIANLAMMVADQVGAL